MYLPPLGLRRPDDHLAKVASIRRFIAGLNVSDPDQQDWYVAAAFYEALHWVDAYLAKRDIHPKSHDERFRYMYRETMLRRVSHHYQRLYIESLHARYGRKRWTSELLAAMARDLSAIRQELRSHLAPYLL